MLENMLNLCIYIVRVVCAYVCVRCIVLNILLLHIYLFHSDDINWLVLLAISFIIILLRTDIILTSVLFQPCSFCCFP